MINRCIPWAMLAASLFLAPAASAQSLDSLKERAGSVFSSSDTSVSGSRILSALGSGSLSLGSMQNVAGVLGYCQEQGYTASTTDRIKARLVDRIGGREQASRDNRYQQGLSGILQGEDGQSFSLSHLKEQIGEKACNAVADRAISSFLGG
ncbi:hypothetical protein GCM10027040_04830 [Halomonas shantousis]